MIEFRLLGPVEVCAGRRPLDVGTAKQQTVLAALLVDAPGPVRVDTLIHRVWDEHPPAEARNVVYAHISRIRRLLVAVSAGGEPVRLNRRSGGYAVDVDPSRVDLHRMRQLADRASADRPTGDGPWSDERQRAALLADALDLWRGEALAGLSGAWVERTRHRLSQQRVDLAVRWAAIASGLGAPAAVVDRLHPLSADNQLHEGLAAALIRALYAAGRTAEALDCYTTIRQRLADELGLDPGAEIRQVHRAVLAGGGTPPTKVGPAPGIRVPAQLPLDVRGFAGRRSELDRLDGLLRERSDTALVIAALSGTAGVGKTALAVHWAHRVRHQFPDGQLYANLRGFDPTGTATAPADAIRAFLDALDVPAPRIPTDLDTRTALYRSLLADRRMLVLLDNARDAEQVRPLLPGSATCLVLVTSRYRLSSLAAGAAAHLLTLGLLSDMDARNLLVHRIGRDRVDREPDAVGTVVAYCTGLPLALSLVAARAAARPDLPVAALADQLRHGADRLDVLADSDPTTDVRSVFSWSRRLLTVPAARLFDLLGLVPGPDIGTAAAASLAGLPVPQATALLAELGTAHLVIEHPPGRYTLHDLLRSYAADLAHTDHTEADRHAALHRLVDHYLHTAYAGHQLLNPHGQPVPPDPPAAGVTPEPLTGADAPAWFTAEHPNLMAAVAAAGRSGFDTACWQLAWAMREYFDLSGHWTDWVTVQHTGLAAALRLGDPVAQARMHRGLSLPYVWLGRFDDARAELQRALELHRECQDPISEARVHMSLAWLADRQGRYEAAISHAEDAIPLFQAAGDALGPAHALTAIGWYRGNLGQYEQTLADCGRALTMLRELGDEHGVASSWENLGFAHHHLGDNQQAIECYQQAGAIYHKRHDRYNEAETLIRLGEAYESTGRREAARDAYRQALDLFDELDHPDAATVRAKLDRLAATRSR